MTTEAGSAINKLHGTSFEGRQLKVQMAHPPSGPQQPQAAVQPVVEQPQLAEDAGEGSSGMDLDNSDTSTDSEEEGEIEDSGGDADQPMHLDGSDSVHQTSEASSVSNESAESEYEPADVAESGVVSQQSPTGLDGHTDVIPSQEPTVADDIAPEMQADMTCQIATTTTVGDLGRIECSF